MTTAVLTLTTSWQLVATGSVYIKLATDEFNAGGALPLDSTPSLRNVLVHVGTTAPAADTFAYHEIQDDLNYVGSQKVYARVATGTRVIKYTPIL